MNILNKKYEDGFTLIELAIVLVIISLLAATFLSTLGSRIETTRRAEAKKEMNTIKQALYGYAMSQSPPHLPCPATASTDGKAESTCTGLDVGLLPWKTLGLGSGDPWGNHYSYWVSSGAAAVTGFDLTTSPIAGEATIKTRVSGALSIVSTSAVVLVMSQGKNGYGGMSVQNKAQPAVPAANIDESDNLDNNLVFISRAPTKVGATTTGGEFDDMLVWVSEYELKAKMVEAGVLP